MKGKGGLLAGTGATHSFPASESEHGEDPPLARNEHGGTLAA